MRSEWRGGWCRAESLGLATGIVFMMCAICFQLLHFTNGDVRADEVRGSTERVKGEREIDSGGRGGL